MIKLNRLTSQHEATAQHCTDVIYLFSKPNLFSITTEDDIAHLH